MDYQYVWQTILNQPTEENEDVIKESDMMDIDSDALSVDKILYDEFITAMIRFLNMMDLGTVEYEQAEDSNEGKPTFQRTSTSSTGDLRALQPVKAKDFELFQNFVDFATQFLPNTRTDLFEQWIYQFGVCLVTLSNKFPIVSGFYKLASCTLVICKRLSRFKNVSKFSLDTLCNHSSQPKRFYHQVNDDNDKKREQALYSEYLIDVLARMERYQDDLLISGIYLVLSAPLELLETRYFVGPLQLALEIGLSQTEVATTAIETLSSILEQAQLHEDDTVRSAYINEIMKVVPFLHDYLITNLQDNDQEVSTENSGRTTATKLTLKPKDKRHAISTGALGVSNLICSQLANVKC